MKKIFLKIFIILTLIIFLVIIYLSTIGIETSRFNSQINNVVKNLNNNLELELKKVKIVLDPINFEFRAKTIGSKLKLRDKIIEIENIKTQISIRSFLRNDFSLKNLEISTKSLELKNLISFIRNFKNTPELYFLEKAFKKGYLISDIKLEFDEKGKIKSNYQVQGLIKDARISVLKKYNLNNINLIFNFSNNIFEFKDIDLSFNNSPFIANQISVKNFEKELRVNGVFENKDSTLNDQFVKNLLKLYFTRIDIKKLDFSSKNEFFLTIDKKFRLNDFQLKTEIKLKNLKLLNNLRLKKFFPKIKNEIDLNNHIINIDYKKDNLIIDGKGDLIFQNETDKIKYNLVKKLESIKFDTDLIIEKNPLLINFLGFEKKLDTKLKITAKGFHIFDGKTVIENFSITENKNQIKVEQLELNKTLQFQNFRQINLNYIDKDLRKNQVKIINQKKNYNLIGSQFNGNALIENLINSDNSDLNILNKNLKLNIKIKKFFLDSDYYVSDLNGKIDVKNNEISNGQISANFSKNKKLKFTVQTSNQEKVTTLFLDQAEPLVKRYKFIKGYKGGSLDFYSSKKGNISNSNLKIYNFKLNDLPILTKLLTLASLQGIADILSGEGISFDEFEMSFNNKKNLMTINEMYAIGPAISILMDGYIEKNKIISLRGSLVPATTINKAIGNIPILGDILIGKKTGEGVFGVSFKIKGPPKNLETTVNPIKTLTPRFITRTLEKIKKN